MVHRDPAAARVKSDDADNGDGFGGAGRCGRRVRCCGRASGFRGSEVARGVAGILHTTLGGPLLPGKPMLLIFLRDIRMVDLSSGTRSLRACAVSVVDAHSLRAFCSSLGVYGAVLIGGECPTCLRCA